MKIKSRAIPDGKGGFYRDRQVTFDQPPAPDCYVVAGIPRGGTSMLAGVLHRLNIDMGPSEAVTIDKQGNINGYHEDKAFQKLTFDILREHNGLTPALIDDARPIMANSPHLQGEQLQRLALLVREREQHNVKWGVKDFGLYFWWQDFTRLCQGKVQVIWIDRDHEEVAHSLHKSGNRQERGLTLDDCRQMVKGWLKVRSQITPSIKLRYEDILLDPAWYVEQIASFASVIPTQAAIDFIKPKCPD